MEKDILDLAVRLQVIDDVLKELKKLDAQSQMEVISYVANELGIKELLPKDELIIETMENKGK